MDTITLNANALRIEIFLRWQDGAPFPELSTIPFRNSTWHLFYEQISIVVEKILEMGFTVVLSPPSITITGTAKNTRALRPCRIAYVDATGKKPFVLQLYEAVVEFVTWYQLPHEHLITLN